MKFRRLNEDTVSDCWPFYDLDVPFRFSNIKWNKYESEDYEGCWWSSVDFKGKYIQGTLVAIEEPMFWHVKATNVTIAPEKKDFGYEGFRGDLAGLDHELTVLKQIVTDMC